MKTCNTPIFNKKIKNAIRKIKRNKLKAPSDGFFYNLFYGYTRRGKWQVEFIRDTRFFKKPYIAAFFFRGHPMGCVSADLVKYKELKTK